ncbi:hypothetical protein PDG61_15115 [Mycolicibacterium sp. BiH015]|uniref:hypothetical protein n=1 Tax=Mycolicibacterium sp. BiH015 TaxID=3018808 RepID=UPI0022E53A8E|nr:hypothetical protein [Mycolicibacterium sp. BiH015]MDA2892252.1 hypothetical protein [Mycolicibacterium sp. BiH015]
MIRVRQELSQLNAGNAAEVPAAVSARIAAALRSAPRPAAHSLPRPTLRRTQWVGLLAGLSAAAVAVAVGVHMLADSSSPTFPVGPTASQITVSAQPFPLSTDELRAVLDAPADLGPLRDPQRRASCLAGLGYAPGLDVLGGRRLEVFGRSGVLILLPGQTSGVVDAVVVEPRCTAADTALLADTSLHR